MAFELREAPAEGLGFSKQGQGALRLEFDDEHELVVDVNDEVVVDFGGN